MTQFIKGSDGEALIQGGAGSPDREEWSCFIHEGLGRQRSSGLVMRNTWKQRSGRESQTLTVSQSTVQRRLAASHVLKKRARIINHRCVDHFMKISWAWKVFFPKHIRKTQT